MGLTEEEKRTLAALNKKANEPDAPPIGQSVRFSVDLGSKEQVARAQKLGLIPPDEPEPDPNAPDPNNPPPDQPPKRPGYFGD